MCMCVLAFVFAWEHMYSMLLEFQLQIFKLLAKWHTGPEQIFFVIVHCRHSKQYDFENHNILLETLL